MRPICRQCDGHERTLPARCSDIVYFSFAILHTNTHTTHAPKQRVYRTSRCYFWFGCFIFVLSTISFIKGRSHLTCLMNKAKKKYFLWNVNTIFHVCFRSVDSPVQSDLINFVFHVNAEKGKLFREERNIKKLHTHLTLVKNKNEKLRIFSIKNLVNSFIFVFGISNELLFPNNILVIYEPINSFCDGFIEIRELKIW